jgi:hypothetical protein
VRNGYKYEITVEITNPWDDGGIPADPRGYRTSEVRPLLRPAFYLAVPLHRIMFRPWFRMIARVGEIGVNEYFLDPVKGNGITPNRYTAKFIADRNGEVFVYVNDAVIGLPWLHSFFYTINNHGTAHISIRLL